MSVLSDAPDLTVADAVNETRFHLGGDGRVVYDRLNGAIATTTAESFTVEFSQSGITSGAYVAIGDEIMLVTSVSTTTVNVLRGQLGTTASTHADNSLIEVNPRFPSPYIKRALRDEIRSWGAKLFQAASVEVAVSDVTNSTQGSLSQGVNLNIGTDWYFPLELRHQPESGDTTWPKVKQWEIVRDANTDDFTDGNALQIYEQVPTGEVRLIYAKPFDVSTFSDSTTLVGTVGLGATMVDIPALGAAWRLMSTRESGRTDTRGRMTSASTEQVPPGHLQSAAQQLKRLRDERISEESARLRARWPYRAA